MVCSLAARRRDVWGISRSVRFVGEQSVRFKLPRGMHLPSRDQHEVAQRASLDASASCSPSISPFASLELHQNKLFQSWSSRRSQVNRLLRIMHSPNTRGATRTHTRRATLQPNCTMLTLKLVFQHLAVARRKFNCETASDVYRDVDKDNNMRSMISPARAAIPFR